MFELKSILAGLALLCATIVPSVSTQRPRTKQQSRGTPIWTDLSKLALSDTAPQDASSVARLRTLAFVAPPSSDGRVTDAQLLAATLASGAAYYDQVTALDMHTAQTLFLSCASLEAARQLARDRQIDVLVWCESMPPAKQFQISIEPTKPQATPLPKLTLSAEGDWLTEAVQLRSRLFESLGTSSKLDKQLGQRVATKRLSASRLWLEGNFALHQVFDTAEPAERKKRIERARSLAAQAIAEDPNFLEAYLLLASCVDELGDSAALKQTLRDAYSRRNPQLHDPLTVHELEADYAHFCSNDLEAAIASYKQILKVCPTDLRGLWSLVDIYLTGDGVNKPLPEDISEASQYARKILMHHPHSAIAQAIENK